MGSSKPASSSGSHSSASSNSRTRPSSPLNNIHGSSNTMMIISEEGISEDRQDKCDDDNNCGGDINPSNVVAAAGILQDQLSTALIAASARRIQTTWRRYREEIDRFDRSDNGQEVTVRSAGFANDDPFLSNLVVNTRPNITSREGEVSQSEPGSPDNYSSPSFTPMERTCSDLHRSCSVLVVERFSCTNTSKVPQHQIPEILIRSPSFQSTSCNDNADDTSNVLEAVVRIEDAWVRYRRAVMLNASLRREQAEMTKVSARRLQEQQDITNVGDPPGPCIDRNRVTHKRLVVSPATPKTPKSSIAGGSFCSSIGASGSGDMQRIPSVAYPPPQTGTLSPYICELDSMLDDRENEMYLSCGAGGGGLDVVDGNSSTLSSILNIRTKSSSHKHTHTLSRRTHSSTHKHTKGASYIDVNLSSTKRSKSAMSDSNDDIFFEDSNFTYEGVISGSSEGSQTEAGVEGAGDEATNNCSRSTGTSLQLRREELLASWLENTLRGGSACSLRTLTGKEQPRSGPPSNTCVRGEEFSARIANLDTPSHIINTSYLPIPFGTLEGPPLVDTTTEYGCNDEDARASPRVSLGDTGQFSATVRPTEDKDCTETTIGDACVESVDSGPEKPSVFENFQHVSDDNDAGTQAGDTDAVRPLLTEEDLPETLIGALRILQNRFRFARLQRQVVAREQDQAIRRVQEIWRRRRDIQRYFNAVRSGREDAAARDIQRAYRCAVERRQLGSAVGGRSSAQKVSEEVVPTTGHMCQKPPEKPQRQEKHEQEDQQQSLPICIVCLDQIVQIALLPCGHAHICSTCATSLRKCPTCRKRIALQIRIFL
eukprot:Tbor_TRINITY_DN4841_c0_g1::TRINITY_DN4841_c0_g1_i1::g.1425::m.1425